MKQTTMKNGIGKLLGVLIVFLLCIVGVNAFDSGTNTLHEFNVGGYCFSSTAGGAWDDNNATSVNPCTNAGSTFNMGYGETFSAENNITYIRGRYSHYIDNSCGTMANQGTTVLQTYDGATWTTVQTIDSLGFDDNEVVRTFEYTGWGEVAEGVRIAFITTATCGGGDTAVAKLYVMEYDLETVGTAPTFNSYNITNTVPVRTNDVLDVNFNVLDESEYVNVSVTWWNSTDGSTWVSHTADDETFTNVSLNTTINTNAQGDLEASDTVSFAYYKAQITATNQYGSTEVNTSSVLIENDPASVSASTSGTTYRTSYGDEVLYMPFDGNSLDYSNIENTGSWNSNESYAKGQLALGAYFDGESGSYINIGNTFLDNVTNTISISTWFYLRNMNNSGVTNGILFGPSTSGQDRLNLVVDSTGDEYYLNVQYRNNTGGTSSFSLGSQNFVKFQWYNLVLVIEDGIALWYVDGNLIETKSYLDKLDTIDLSVASVNYRIGDDGWNSNTPFNATIDEVRIYNRSLSEQEISDLYNNQALNYSPADIGDTITFNLTGTDTEENEVQLKVCSNEGATWNSCNVLAQNLTGITFDSATPTSITATHTTNETSRVNTGYAILYDGGNYTYQNVSYYVNEYPTLDTFSSIDTSGGTTYFFNEYMDYFRINMNDTYDGTNLTPYITVFDPDNVIKVSNQPMTLQSGATYQYGTDTFLDAVGIWNVTINVTDTDGALTTYSTTFTVESINLTTLGRIYAYDTGNYSSYAQITSLIDLFDYYAVEIHINNSIMEENWTAFLDIVGGIKNDSQLLIITLDDDLSNQTRTVNNIATYYDDLTGGDYLNGILMLKISTDASVSSGNTATLNNITKQMFQNVSNSFPIYVRGYSSNDINENYAQEDPYPYITATDRTAYIDEEMSFLRNTTDKSRFYYGMNDTFKGYARDWQDDIISKLRSTINTSSTYAGHIGELNNYDIIVANNASTTQNFSITSILETSGTDVYDLSTKTILELDTDRTFTLNISAYSASILYFTNLTKLVVNDEDEINLFGDSATEYPLNITYGGPNDEAFLFVSGSTNPDDARIKLTDPTFNEMDFYVWYGINNFEAIADWSRYNKTIIADDSNETWIDELTAETNVFGYTAVNDYGDNNEPPGCTAGVNCSSWNRTRWLDAEELEIDGWTDMNDSVNIFIDGLDIGAVNDVDGLFDDALVDLSNYVRITKGRTLILNTYTTYENYANLGDYTMRESACARWSGTEANPTYSYEDITLEKTRAKFHKTHNVPVLAQVFGNITDYKKSYYCFMQSKVLYGDLAEYSYNQPTFDYTGAPDDFTWNYYKYPDLGAQLEDDWTENGDVLTRRFENGIVSVNTTAKTVDFENNLAVTAMTFCAYYYDNDDGANDEGYMHFVINDNLSKSFDVVDTDLTAFVKTFKCQSMGTHLYEPSGFYELEFYYLDSDANYIGNSGLYMYHGDNASQDMLSSWDQVLNDHPSNDETDYFQFVRGDNWAVQLHIEAEAEKTIDEVTSVITRTETGVEVKNVTFTSAKDWSLPLYDKQVLLNKSQFNELTLGNGTILNVNYNSSCDTNAPTYTNTSIDSYNWSACYYNATSSGYEFKVIIPHLSTQTYLIDGNTYPTVDSQSITLNDLIAGVQDITIAFNVSDADNNTIDSCKVDIDGSMTTGSYSNGLCTVTITPPLNSTTQVFTPYVFDEYDGNGSGTTYDSMTSNFHNLSWDSSSTDSNTSIQYFWNYYNLTYNWDKNFTDIAWSINSSFDTVNVNLTNGTNEERFERNYSLVTLADYELVPDVADTYYVNSAETIWRLLNITNNLGSTLPQFDIRFVPEQYLSGSQTLTSYNGSSWNAVTFTSGNPMIFNVTSISNGSKNQYNASHQASVIYTTNDTLTYTANGTTRTYFWNSSDGLGLKYNFMFTELLSTSNSIYHNIAYADLENWEDRTSSSNVFKDDAGNTLVQNSDYTLTDTPLSDLLILNWAPLIGDNFYRFNLSYTATVVVAQCNDGADNDGDGDIDYPADAGCSSTSDDSENSDSSTPAPGGGGGGGGGGGSSGGSDDDGSINLNKIDCEVFITPKTLRITDDALLKDFSIRNDEAFSYDPNLEDNNFRFISGNRDLMDRIAVTNTISSIDSGSNYQTGVRFSPSRLVSITGAAEVELVMSSTRCKDISVPITIEITERTGVLDEIIDSVENKTIKESTNELLNKRVFGANEELESDNKILNFINKLVSFIDSVATLTVLSLFFWGFLFFRTTPKWTGSELGEILVRGFLVLLLSAASFVIIWLISG